MNELMDYYRNWFHAFYQENPVERPEDDINEELEGDIINPKELEDDGVEIEK
jgi:hypothetical protein